MLAKNLFLVVLVTIAAACQHTKESTEFELAFVQAEDAVPLAYVDFGQGETSLVFVHGWCCDMLHWEAQLEEFKKDYRVVALDLGGHGASGAGRAQWTLESLGKDVQAVVEHLDLKQVILVGHSLGGPVSLIAAKQMPQRVRGIVGVDCLHDAEFEFTEEMLAGMLQAFDDDFAGSLEGSIRAGVQAEGSEALENWILERGLLVDRAAAVAIPRAYIGLNVGELLASAKVPVRCINSGYPNASMPTNVEVNQRYADFEVVLVEDAGHFVMLEQPAEFNALLRTFLEELSGP